MSVDEAVETPQCSLKTSNADSPFDLSPITNNKKKIGTREHKATSSWLVGWLIEGLRSVVSQCTWAYEWCALHGFFLKDPSPYLREFRRKPWETQN